MRFPLILADFGPVAFTFLCCALALPLVCAIISITIARCKKQDQRSVSGVVFGVIAIFGAAYFGFFASPPMWTEPIYYPVVLPIPLGVLGVILSLRRQPNQESGQ